MTKEFEKGDYVRVKLSQLYSQIRKMVKDGDKKYIVVKYSPEIYQIDKVIQPDHEGYEKLRYTLKNLEVDENGEDVPVITQQKMNNPDKPREQKRFFASDFIKIDKKDVMNDFIKEGNRLIPKDGFDIHKALKLNVIKDEETEAKKTKEKQQPKVRIRQEPIPIVPREKSTRIRKPNSLLKDYAEINNKGESQKELGQGFVFVGNNPLFI